LQHGSLRLALDRFSHQVFPLRYCEELRRASLFLLISTEKFRKARRLAARMAAKWPSRFRASTVRLSPSPRERLRFCHQSPIRSAECPGRLASSTLPLPATPPHRPPSCRSSLTSCESSPSCTGPPKPTARPSTRRLSPTRPTSDRRGIS